MGDGVAVGAAVLAVVGPVAPVPGDGVHGAVDALDDVVLAQEVGVDEAADLGGAAVARRVAAVVGRLGRARGRALLVVAVRVELVAHVGVLAVEEGGVDGAAQRRRGRVARERRRRGVLEVAVAARDHDPEGLARAVLRSAPLALIPGTFLRHQRVLPQRAADRGQRRWVGAARARVHAGVALEVEIEARAAVRVGIASLLAQVRVVGLQEEQAQVGPGAARSGVALEGARIAVGSCRLAGSVAERLEGEETFCRVGRRYRTMAICSPHVSRSISTDISSVLAYLAEEHSLPLSV